MRRILLIASLVPLFLTCIPARAQNQSKFAAEFSDESTGSIAPQNGFGFGPAFVYGTNFQLAGECAGALTVYVRPTAPGALVSISRDILRQATPALRPSRSILDMCRPSH